MDEKVVFETEHKFKHRSETVRLIVPLTETESIHERERLVRLLAKSAAEYYLH